MSKRRFLTLLTCSCLVFVIAANNMAADEVVWAVTQDQFLVSWDSASPNDFTFGTSITGLQANEQILGIDFRPADGQLYAIGSSNQLYLLGLDGAASAIGSVFGSPLDGSAFGYDFNPTIDRSRIDTNTNNNYVVNPNDGGIVQVTNVFYPSGDVNFDFDPNINHIGYTNSFAGAATTQLYAIDTGLDILATQANSAGTLGTVGSLGIDITELGGFDISGTTGTAFGAFQTAFGPNSLFYTLDLATGQATLVGEIGGGTVITALAVQSSAVPEPTSAVVFACLASCVFFPRRRRLR